MGASRGASSLDEARGGSDVRHCQQQAWPSLFCKCLWTLAIWVFDLVFLLFNYWFVGCERDFSLEVGLHSCDEGRLGAASSSQGPTPGIIGEAPQGLQGPSGARGGEKGEGGRLGRSSGGLEEGGRRGHAAEGADHDGRGGRVQGSGRGHILQDAAADLDKEKGLIKADLASARETYREMKGEFVKSEIAQSTTEEAMKKALEDLEAERARSCCLSDDVDRLKRALLEKEGAIAQAGKVIEDLRVANTNLARSYKQIERANTNWLAKIRLWRRGFAVSFFTLSCLFWQGAFRVV